MIEPWQEVREGELDPDRAQEISRAARYDRLSRLAGTYNSGTFVPDASTLVLGTAELSIACRASCANAPEEAEAAMRSAQDLLHELYNAGSAVSGPMRISVVAAPGRDFRGGLQPIAWPLTSIGPLDQALDLRMHPPTEDRLAYSGARIDDPMDIGTLVDLRDRAHRGEVAGDWASYRFFWIPADPDFHYELRFRDALPIEDERGVVPFVFDNAP